MYEEGASLDIDFGETILSRGFALIFTDQEIFSQLDNVITRIFSSGTSPAGGDTATRG
jgi:hypothetical protein